MGGILLGALCGTLAMIVAVWATVVWVVRGDFPGMLYLGGLVLGVLAVQGLILSLSGVPGTDPAGRRGAPALHDRHRARVTPKRVLVTGGAGFISSNLVRHLLDATPYEVVSLDALTYAGNMDNVADVMGHERLSFVHGDIRDPELVGEVVADVDVIVNAAAESHVEKSIEEGASEFVTTNVEGTQILLDAIRRTLSTASSSSPRARSTDRRARAHGRGAPAQPAQPLRGDEGGRRPARLRVLDDLRPPDRDRPAVQQLRAVPASGEGRAALRDRRARDEPLTVHGDGHASRDWVFVDDVAEAIEAAIAADDDVHGEVINLATGRDISVEAIADLVLEQLGKPKSLKVHTPERPGQVDRHIGSTARPSACSGGAPRRLSRTAWRHHRVVRRQSSLVGITASGRQRRFSS